MGLSKLFAQEEGEKQGARSPDGEQRGPLDWIGFGRRGSRMAERRGSRPQAPASPQQLLADAGGEGAMALSKEEVEAYLENVRSDVNMKAGRASFRYCDMARDLSTQRMSTRQGPGGSYASRAIEPVRVPKEASPSAAAGTSWPADQSGEFASDSLSWRMGVTRQLDTLSNDMTSMSQQLSAIEDALSVLTQQSATPRRKPSDSASTSPLSFNDPMSMMRRAVGIQEKPGSSSFDA